MPDVFGGSRLGGVLLAGFGVLVCMFLAAPALIVVPMSFSDSSFLQFPPRSFSLRWYEVVGSSPTWRAAIVTSLALAGATAFLSVAAGLFAAYGLVRVPSRARAALTMVLLAPAVVPAILIGIGLFFLLARVGLVGSFGGLLVAHTALAVPVVVVILTAALSQFDPTQERAARSLGATWLESFVLVVLPQIALPLTNAALLAFLTSLDEVVVAMFLSTGDTTTMPKVMFLALRDRIDPSISAVSTLLLGLVTTIVPAFVWRSAATPAKSV